MSSRTLGLLVVGLSILVAQSGWAQGDPKPGAEQQVRRLVLQLGSDDFEERESAMKALEKLGEKALPALREGAKSKDNEIRTRSMELLDRLSRSKLELALDALEGKGNRELIFDTPTWSRFSKLVGDSPANRSMFVKMCQAEGALMVLAEEAPEKAALELGRRCRSLQLTVKSPRNQEKQWTDNFMGLLCVLSSPDVKPDEAIVSHAMMFTSRPGAYTLFKKTPSMRPLLEAIIRKHQSPKLTRDFLGYIERYELVANADVVMDYIDNTKIDGHSRASALVVLGKIGAKKFIGRIEKHFSDTSYVSNLQKDKVKTRIQLRDVALAMAASLRGDKLLEYPFPVLHHMRKQAEHNPKSFFFTPYYVGFQNDAERAKAFALYKARHGN